MINNNSNNLENINSISSLEQSNINSISNEMDISKDNNDKEKKKRNRQPLYYYYKIGGKLFKYTCKKKEAKYNLPFICSDSTCPAKGNYNKNNQVFTPGTTPHIPYENHSYIIPKLLYNKFKNNEFKEEDFIDNMKNIGYYFKLMFLNDFTLDPTLAKSIFKGKYPNVDISGKEIATYINTKFREAKAVNTDKIMNTERIFNFYDNEGNNISQVFEYIDLDTNKKLRFVIIAKNNMLENLQSNQIKQFFMDCTYKAVPPSKDNFKLMVLSGFNINESKIKICAFILLPNEKEITFDNIFGILKDKYHFNPLNMMCDFRISQINSMKKIFKDCNLHCCFYHFSHAIWLNFKKYNLCKKGTYTENLELLFNLQLLCFINKGKIKTLLKK